MTIKKEQEKNILFLKQKNKIFNEKLLLNKNFLITALDGVLPISKKLKKKKY